MSSVEPYQNDDDEWVELYHGTSGDGAERICERGLLFVDLDSEVRLVSEQLGVNAEAVRALADRIGHTKVAHARTSSVSVAGQPIHAARYAGVAGGEARRQFYQAAWLIMNDSDDQHAADVWSFEQTKADRVLVSICLPADVVRDALGADRFGNPRGLGFVDRHINLRIEREIPVEWVSDVRPIERALGSVDVQREWGRIPGVQELPSDGTRASDPIWWESTLQRWFGSGTGSPC